MNVPVEEVEKLMVSPAATGLPLTSVATTVNVVNPLGCTLDGWAFMPMTEIGPGLKFTASSLENPAAPTLTVALPGMVGETRNKRATPKESVVAVLAAVMVGGAVEDSVPAVVV